MFFDIDESRPEEPRVPSGLSVGDRVLLTLILHVLLVLTVILLPRLRMFQPATVVVPPQPHQIVQFVDISPRVPVAPPVHTPVPSDLDHRAASPEHVPKPQNDDPVSHGNTSEKVVGAPDERAKGPDQPHPDPTPPPPSTGTVIPDTLTPPPPSSGGLGESLHNLDKLLRNENYNNPQGSQNQNDAGISFDSKGVDFDPWLRRFKAQVMSNWLVPPAAAVLKGHVVFQFWVSRDGTITDIHIVQPSSVDAFNVAAQSALRLSNPTVPLPAAYPSDKILFTVTFFYNEVIHH